MPLFMMTTGYFFYHGIQKYTIKEVLLRKIKTLVLPVLCWKTISIVIFGNYNSIPKFIFELFKGYITCYWYIQAVIVCSFIAMIVKRIW